MLTRRVNYVSGAVALIAVCATCLSQANADLPANFTDMGFETVFEQNVSGLKSSYHSYTRGTSGVNNIPDEMFTLSDQRVYYPSVGTVPSPGGASGRRFDEGAIGLKIDGDNIVIRVAGRLDPNTGVKIGSTWFGQGDVFITVDDSQAGVGQFALLNSWAKDGVDYRSLGSGHFDSARDFHAEGGLGGASLEGYLVELDSSDDVRPGRRTAIVSRHKQLRRRSGLPHVCTGRNAVRFGESHPLDYARGRSQRRVADMVHADMGVSGRLDFVRGEFHSWTA